MLTVNRIGNRVGQTDVRITVDCWRFQQPPNSHEFLGQTERTCGIKVDCWISVYAISTQSRNRTASIFSLPIGLLGWGDFTASFARQSDVSEVLRQIRTREQFAYGKKAFSCAPRRCFAVTVTTAVRSFFIVVLDPLIDIGLQLFNALVNLFSKRNLIPRSPWWEVFPAHEQM